jgi:hypothetical protein
MLRTGFTLIPVQRLQMKRSVLVLATLALLLGGMDQARAEFIIEFSQQGNNVVATGTGSLNLTALTFRVSPELSAAVNPSLGTTIAGPGGLVDEYYAPSMPPPPAFGTGLNTYVSSGTGATVGDGVYTNVPPWGYDVIVPFDYRSGGSLSDSSTYDNTTFSKLGLTPGTYTYSWGSGPTADDIKIVVPSAAPEPATLTLLATGCAAFGGLRLSRRRRKATKPTPTDN